MSDVNRTFRQNTLDFFIEQAPIMGDIALNHFGNLSEDDVKGKIGHIADPVSIADIEISEHILPTVNKEYGNKILLLTEESAKKFQYTKKDLLNIGKPILVIDELDGTKNFTEGKEHFSMLLGLAEKKGDMYQMTVGLVYKPLTKEFYFATTDSDATYINGNGKQETLAVSKRNEMKEGITPVNVAIGRKTFPTDYPEEYYNVTEVMESFENANLEQVARNSKFSAGLEIIDVAKGDVDAYVIAKAANWDYAGASLILRQAGGEAYLAKSVDMLTNPQPWHLQLDGIEKYHPAFFTNKSIDKELFGYMKQHLSK